MIQNNVQLARTHTPQCMHMSCMHVCELGRTTDTRVWRIPNQANSTFCRFIIIIIIIIIIIRNKHKIVLSLAPR